MLLALALIAASAITDGPHAKASLVSPSLAAPTSGALPLALHLDIEPGWHVYWVNPGAAGIPASLQWSSPESARTSPFSWPTPDTIPVPPLMSYGYSDSVTLPFAMEVSGAPGDTLSLEATARWQVCHEICILETQEVRLRLPVAVAPQTDPAQSERFRETLARTPRPLEMAKSRLSGDDSLVVLEVRGMSPPEARILPVAPGIIDDAAPQVVEPVPDGFRILAPRDPYSGASLPDSLEFVLLTGTSQGEGPSFQTKAPVRARTESDLSTAPPPSGTRAGGLLLALAFAFLGGLLLNLMPCVLPVLSLKVLDLLKHAGQSRRDAILHGTSYAAGVILSFLALAIALLVLRSGGSALGWGFQLQSPPVVGLLSGLMLLIACNLWGLFEPGASLARLGGDGRGNGLAGSFLTGLAATVVATPCTAPFMGAALGYTLTRPALEALLVFAVLGAGLAAPVVAITALPSLGKLLPRPGAWMESLKQFLGFAMAATAAWLGWLLTRLAGSDGLLPLFGLWLLVGIFAWILGRWSVPHRSRATRTAARLVATALLLGGIALVLPVRPLAVSSTDSAGEELWKPGLTEELRRSGEPWFLHFTADWCLSCQVNERNAFRDERVEMAFRDRGIRRVKADWTSRDSAIARELERWGRQGIPFYVLSDGRTETILPEFVTPGIVLDALERIPSRK